MVVHYSGSYYRCKSDIMHLQITVVKSIKKGVHELFISRFILRQELFYDNKGPETQIKDVGQRLTNLPYPRLPWQIFGMQDCQSDSHIIGVLQLLPTSPIPQNPAKVLPVLPLVAAMMPITALKQTRNIICLNQFGFILSV